MVLYWQGPEEKWSNAWGTRDRPTELNAAKILTHQSTSTPFCCDACHFKFSDLFLDKMPHNTFFHSWVFYSEHCVLKDTSFHHEKQSLVWLCEWKINHLNFFSSTLILTGLKAIEWNSNRTRTVSTQRKK